MALPPNIRTLGWLSLLNDWASEMIVPLLPAFLASTLGAGPLALGLIEGLADSANAALKLASGVWSDRIRQRRRLMAAGYLVSNLMRPLMALAATWPMLLLFRFADRIGKGLRTAPRDALLAASIEPERLGQAYGFQRGMDHVGAMLGAISASAALALIGENYRAVFLISLVPGLACVLVAWFGPAKDTPRASGTPLPIRTLLAGARDLPPEYFRFLWASVVFSVAGATDLFLLMRAGELGMPVWSLPLLWTALHFIKAASAAWGGRLTDRKGPMGALTLGWALYAVAYFGLGWIRTPGPYVALFIFYGLFYGLTEAPERALVARCAPESHRGSAFGLFHLATGLAALPAGLFFGGCWQLGGPRLAFSGAAALSLVALGLLRIDRFAWK